MKIFKTNKLEERKALENEGFKCSEVQGEKSVDFVFELEEDVPVQDILSRGKVVDTPKASKASSKGSRRGRNKK